MYMFHILALCGFVKKQIVYDFMKKFHKEFTLPSETAVIAGHAKNS